MSQVMVSDRQIDFLTQDRGCKLVLTRNLCAWHLFNIEYETMYNVFVPAQ